MVNEVIHAMKTQKIDGLIIKLDFSRAYDSVDWSCLLHMKCIKMNQKWIQWIQAILTSTRMSILVNGSPTKEFSPDREIRQGDPLTPYLFLLIGEVMSKLIKRATQEGIIKGIIFKFHDHQITHFQYVDDTILFIANDEQSIKGVRKVLQLFKVITGLSVNFSKNKVYHVSNTQEECAQGVQILNCQAGKIPFKYLGDWVVLDHRACKFWYPLLETVKRKFPGVEM